MKTKSIEISKPARQRAWGWPAVINFFLGGAGAGLFLFVVVVEFFSSGPSAVSKKISFALLCSSLVVLGFIALATEAGRPHKAVYLLRKLRHVWLSRETLFALVFVGTALLDGFQGWIGLRVIAILSALALLTSQGLIFYQVRAIESWRVSAIPPFFVSSGFASGSGAFLLIESTGPIPPVANTMIIAVIGIAVNLSIWLVYLSRLRPRISAKPGSGLSDVAGLARPAAFGHILALAFLILALVWQENLMGAIIDMLTALSGSAILGSIWVQKTAIILNGSHKKGISI